MYSLTTQCHPVLIVSQGTHRVLIIWHVLMECHKVFILYSYCTHNVAAYSHSTHNATKYSFSVAMYSHLTHKVSHSTHGASQSTHRVLTHRVAVYSHITLKVLHSTHDTSQILMKYYWQSIPRISQSTCGVSGHEGGHT